MTRDVEHAWTFFAWDLDTKAEKTVRNKPADPVNSCWIGGVRFSDMAACGATFPLFREPRTAAGDAWSGHVLEQFLLQSTSRLNEEAAVNGFVRHLQALEVPFRGLHS